MDVDDRIMPEIVALAKAIEDRDGIDALVEYEYHQNACGCLGPRDGDRLCPCAQRRELARHLSAVLGRMGNEAAALKAIRTRIVRALRS